MAGRRDPGSAIFLSSRLSGLRWPSEPSLRDGFASPGPASAHQETDACDENGKSGAGGLGGAGVVARPIIQAARDGIAAAAAAHQELAATMTERSH